MPRGQLSQAARPRIQVTKNQKTIERLRAENISLQKIIQDKNTCISELQSQLADKEQQRKALAELLYKPHKPAGHNGERKKRVRAYHRPNPADDQVTETFRFSLNQCPICDRQVGNAVDMVEKYEEDIELSPRIKVRKYLISRHWCSHCETYVKSPHIPKIRRIGLNTMGYILYARYRLRMPYELIKESLGDLHNFRISAGEIAAQLKEARELSGNNYAAPTELIRAAKVIYADETGWRMNGQNWWLWVFVTDKGVRYVIDDSRGKGVPEMAPGENRNRVIISDGYAVYAKLAGDKQQCWVHLLRVARRASMQLYGDLVKLFRELAEALSKDISARDRPLFEKKLGAISRQKYPEAQAVKVQERIGRHQSELLTCLRYTDVLPENNMAERAIRPQVVARKISGGSRSIAGAETHAVNASIIETLPKTDPDTPILQKILTTIRQPHSDL